MPFYDQNYTGSSGGVSGISDLVLSNNALIVGSGGVGAELAAGTNGHVLTMVAGTPTWAVAPGAGSVAISGTPANNQVAVWVDASSIEGSNLLTFDNTNFQFRSATPALQVIDTDAGDLDVGFELLVAATDTGSGTEDVDVTLQQQIAGALTAFLTADADGDITFGTGRTVNVATLALTNDLGVTHGGMGADMTAGAIGAIPYASATNTYTTLAAVATGNALISGGVGTAPSWGKVGLTTHVSGTLPEGSGGTNQTTYTTGDILYASGANTLSKLPAGTLNYVLTSGGPGVAPSWAVNASGNVSNTGTPVNNQIAVWTDATTIEGTSALTWNNTDLTLGAEVNHKIGVATSTTLNAAGADLTVEAATADGNGKGGTLNLNAGQPGATGASGDLYVYCYNANSGAGGLIDLTAGSAAVNGNGGSINFTGGSGAGTGNGGGFQWLAGHAGTTGTGGAFNFTAGDGAGGQTGGAIGFTTGSASGGGTAGNLTFATGSGGSVGSGAMIFQPGSSGSKFTFTGFASTGLTADTEFVGFDLDLDATKTWATGTTQANQREVYLRAPTYAAAGATTITTAVSLAISGAPSAGANMTLTNAYALDVEAGQARFQGGTTSPGVGTNGEAWGNLAQASATSTTSLGADAQATALNGLALGTSSRATAAHTFALGTGANSSHAGSICIGSGAVSGATGQFIAGSDSGPITDVFFGAGFNSATPSDVTWGATAGLGTDIAAGDVYIAVGRSTGNADPGRLVFQTTVAGVSGTSQQTLADTLVLDGGGTTMTVTEPAKTSLTASTEVIGVDFDLSATQTWATGAIATQREMVVQAPTYAFAGASVITNAATVAITGAPTAGTNATITNAWALDVEAGEARFQGGVTSPGGGTNSETFGSGSAAAGLRATALGYLASAAGQDSSAFGRSSSAAGVNSTAFGQGASAGANGNNSAFGSNSSAAGTSSVAFGVSSSASGAQGTSIGASSTATNTNSTSIGFSADATGSYDIAIGASAQTSGAVSIGIGNSVNASHNYSFVVGEAAASSAANQIMFGSASASAHYSEMVVGYGDADATPGDVTFRTTNGSGTNIAAGDIIWAVGRSTGNADPGRLVFQTTVAGASGTSLQTLADTLTLDSKQIIAANDVFIQRGVDSGITASTTQTQGQQPLTAEVNEVSTVANTNDTVTMPPAVAGRVVTVINNGANILQVFPASGDNLGAGVDTAISIAAGTNQTVVAYDATNWESI